MTDDGGVLFLGDEWLAQADVGLGRLTPVSGAVAIGFVVTGGPIGERRYRLVLGPDRVGADREPAVSVTLTMGWDLAVALNQGRASAQQAVLDGRIGLAGDPVVLLGHQEQLAGVDDVLADLRARTVY
jgi:hypothetical protein